MTSKGELLLHPVRLRIVLALAGRRQTAQQLAERLADVPQATLYRQINKLAQGGAVAVVEERPVRGTVEKVYALREEGANLTAQDLAGAGRDEHLRYFMQFLLALLGTYERYLRREQIDLQADGVGYREAALNLSDEEFAALIGQLAAAVGPFANLPPAPGRRRRLLATIVMPDDQ